MDVRLKFLGGAQTVTGSKYLLQTTGFTLLVDCGLFQGLKELRLRNWDDFTEDATKIDAVVLTHAHIDHSGYLPRLVKQGFNGPVYCTNATASLLDIMLRDAAKLQEEEAEFARKKGYSKHDQPLPLFNTTDAETALSLIKSFEYDETVALCNHISASFFDAGHILGSAIVKFIIQGDTQEKSIVFSGDLGRYNQPLLRDPTGINSADILFIESTYGDRLNTFSDIEEELAEVVNEAFNNGGCVLIPSFAVGRTQLLLYYFHQLIESGQIPACPIYIDSPMAISATQVHKLHRKDHKLSEGREESIFDFPNFKYYRSQESSVNINHIDQGAVIISASGMCTGGRILHHLYHRLPRKNDILLFTGYQAEGTRGRKLLEGDDTSRIFGIDVPVKCNVRHINGLSAHADQAELLQWAGQLKEAPKLTFVVHGEIKSAMKMANELTHTVGWPNVIIPNYLESFELFKAI
ncbi:MBL fold metallo-hydrolase [Fulvivirga sp. RKSG066]|uniref:MBL fold metallo-hydrolase RNA specificity domain-containing protein n=1 Tax=Fulvivirga aurantia TaxID=2529383 RepID=UPI0012BC0510|nr:MBL fold metallo-hydrolase [Fulvivirga aurantia]MTI21773.1 MBL fold metallo-hydrolase [Fulvivirga aurantia]